jgi:methyl-accepting chemotaxis protein
MEDKLMLEETADVVAASIHQLNTTSQELATMASGLSDKMHSLRMTGQLVIQHIMQTNEILHFISNIACSSILGLNAAIEDARAGNLSSSSEIIQLVAHNLYQKTK